MTEWHERQINRQLSREALHAVAALRLRGTAPNVEDHPTLWNLWRSAHETLKADGPTRCRAAFRHESVTYDVIVQWDTNGALVDFELRSQRTGTVILRGDQTGPLFVANRVKP